MGHLHLTAVGSLLFLQLLHQSKLTTVAIRSTDVLVCVTPVGRGCNLVAAVDSISVSSSSGIVSIPSSVIDMFVCQIMPENGNSYIHTIHTLLTAPHRGFSAPMKQSTKQQNTTTTTVKNPNWPEANQLAIYKCSWEVEPGTTRNKFSEWSEQVLNPGSPDLKASALTTGPHCLLLGHTVSCMSDNCGLCLPRTTLPSLVTSL